jgi:hypothetical protein
MTKDSYGLAQGHNVGLRWRSAWSNLYCMNRLRSQKSKLINLIAQTKNFGFEIHHAPDTFNIHPFGSQFRDSA